MKKILMTAVAVSALSAGAASAASLDVGTAVASATLLASSSIGGVALNTSTTGVSNPVTVALENDAPGSATAVLTFIPSSSGIITAGSYLVTWNITGGTFDLTSNPTFAGTGSTASSVTVTLSTASATSITALVVATAPVTGVNVTVPILMGTAKTTVAISGTWKSQAGADVDGGAITSKNVIDYRAAMKASATAVPAVLGSASGFKKFLTTGVTSSVQNSVTSTIIGTSVGLVPNTVSSDPVYKTVGALATAFDATAIGALVSAASVTVNGSLTALKPVIATAGTAAATTTAASYTNGESPATAGSGTLTVSSNNLGGLVAGTGVVGLSTISASAPVAAPESAYTITIVPTMTVGYTPQTYTAAKLGSVSYEGSSILAPWVNDGVNGINTLIRLGNRTAADIANVQVTLLNPSTTATSGTVASTAACNVGTIPKSGELVIYSSTLKGCFGSFGRSDVVVTVAVSDPTGSNTSTSTATALADKVITAKMRTQAVNGTTTETSLGGGVVAGQAN